MPDYNIQHPLAGLFQSAVAQPLGEFSVACAISKLLADGDESPEQLFSDTIESLVCAGPTNVTAVLNWFLSQGFSGPQGVVTIAHSDLNFVLEYRQGIPISLAVLLLEASRRVGLSGFGVNFPGHFLVNIEDVLIDPLSFTQISEQHLSQMTKQVGESPHKLLRPATVQMIALRMLNNIKAQYVVQKNFANALEVVDLQLASSGDQAELVSSLHFERGEYWQQLGLSAAAHDAYLLCAQRCPYPHLAEKARERAQQIAGNDDTFH